MTSYKNKHLSYSRLSRFEQCPLSFKLHYIDKQHAEPGDALKFGKLIHAVLETLVREHMTEERTASLSVDRAVELYRTSWADAILSGIELFQEGIEILKAFVADQGEIDHRDVLGIEKEFALKVDDFDVIGFIDRVDWVDDETIEVIDYKTSRNLFTRDEVENSLQLSLYHLAAQQIWPWAKKVRLTFHMLRHGVRMVTQRTPDQLAAAVEYVRTIGRSTEQATEYLPRLNSNCIYCDHRTQCPAYADALGGKRAFVCEDPTDLEAVAKEREEVARLAKVLYARKSELEGVLKTHLKEKDELLLGGVRYQMYNTTKLTFPLDATIELTQKATGMSREDLIGKLAVIDKKPLDNLIKELGKTAERSRVALLKAELEAVAQKSHSPRFWAKEVAV